MPGMVSEAPLRDKGSVSTPRKREAWQDELLHSPVDAVAAARSLGFSEALAEQVGEAARSFGFRTTRYYLGLARSADLTDPILRQVLPSPDELALQPEDYVPDAVGDLRPEHHPAPGLVQKYPGQALLITTGQCAVNCRFCFRRSYPYEETRAGQEPALAAIAADPSIREVILSGGDPLVLPDAVLARLLGRLAAIPHVRRVRVHSRLPVVLPSRITPALTRLLQGCGLPVWLVTHFNHPLEITSESVAACRALLRAGVPVLNQAVLLRGVNDDESTQVALQEGLVDAGIKPYYLHQLDRVRGAAHFEVDEGAGRSLVQALRVRLTGIAMPSWVRDVPGAKSKTPLLSVLLCLLLAACGGDRPAEPERIELDLASVSSADVEPPEADESGTPTPRASVSSTASEATALTSSPPPLASFEHLLAADLDGDGVDEILAGGGSELRWGTWPQGASSPSWEGRWEAKGMLQVTLGGDLDGDGREEVVAAFGVGRDHAAADLELVVIDREGGSTVVAPLWRRKGERNQVTALDLWPRDGGGFDLYVAAFESRFVVQGGILPLTGGEPRWLPGHSLRMGMVRAVSDFDGDGKPEVAIGRLYGDGPEEAGDLRVLDSLGTARPVPSLRGVRAIGTGDLDGDGRAELLFGDGWHKRYGELARFRPSIARSGPEGWATELVEERSDQYAVEQIGSQGARLIAGGNQNVRVYEQGPEGWTLISGPHASSLTGAWTVMDGRMLVLGGRTLRRVELP